MQADDIKQLEIMQRKTDFLKKPLTGQAKKGNNAN